MNKNTFYYMIGGSYCQNSYHLFITGFNSMNYNYASRRISFRVSIKHKR